MVLPVVAPDYDFQWQSAKDCRMIYPVQVDFKTYYVIFSGRQGFPSEVRSGAAENVRLDFAQKAFCNFIRGLLPSATDHAVIAAALQRLSKRYQLLEHAAKPAGTIGDDMKVSQTAGSTANNGADPQSVFVSVAKQSTSE